MNRYIHLYCMCYMYTLDHHLHVCIYIHNLEPQLPWLRTAILYHTALDVKNKSHPVRRTPMPGFISCAEVTGSRRITCYAHITLMTGLKNAHTCTCTCHLCVQVKGMQEELTALEPELKQKSKETEELMKRLAVDQEQANQVRDGTHGNVEEHLLLSLLNPPPISNVPLPFLPFFMNPLFHPTCPPPPPSSLLPSFTSFFLLPLFVRFSQGAYSSGARRGSCQQEGRGD